MKNRYFLQVSRFITCRKRCDRRMLSAGCHWTVASWWHGDTHCWKQESAEFVDCGRRDDEVFMTRVKSPQHYPKTTEQHLQICDLLNSSVLNDL